MAGPCNPGTALIDTNPTSKLVSSDRIRYSGVTGCDGVTWRRSHWQRRDCDDP